MKALSSTEIKQVTDSLLVCMTVQRTYGKQIADLPILVKSFANLLSGYDINDIIGAIKHWVLNSQDFPTPADINLLLSDEKVFDERIYSRITAKIRSGQQVDKWEWNYIHDYDNNWRMNNE